MQLLMLRQAEEVEHFNEQKYGNEKDFWRSCVEAI